MSRIVPCLWFDKQAEEAASFYVSLFPDSGVDSLTRYGPAGPGPEGSVLVVAFHLRGEAFMALNGGPHYTFTPAVSFMVTCETQNEVDGLWERLGAGSGDPGQCGWIKDRFGLSWQIVPSAFLRMMKDPDTAKVGRVTGAMMGMSKLVIADLERAFEGK